MSQNLELDEILSSADESSKLKKLMSHQRCEENLSFILAARDYKLSKKKSNKYIHTSSKSAVNITPKVRQNILESHSFDSDVFEEAVKEIKALISTNIIPIYNQDKLSNISLSSGQSHESIKTGISKMMSLIFSKPKSHSGKGHSNNIVSIVLPNIYDIEKHEIKDPNETLNSLIIGIIQNNCLKVNNFEVKCGTEIVDNNAIINEFRGKTLQVKYNSIFMLNLPNGKTIGVKVDASILFKNVLRPLLTKFGYRFKFFNFIIANANKKINPDDFVGAVDNEVVSMSFKSSLISSNSMTVIY
ncbi:MAG: hypothetical protein MHPSP_001256 [Paramarteilia canceri]